MVSVRLSKHQQETRQLTGIVLVIVMIIFWTLLYIASSPTSSSSSSSSSSISSSSFVRRRRKQQQRKQQIQQEPIIMNVLYIVTSSNEYNTGDKETQKGQDRFMEILVPVVVDSVASITSTSISTTNTNTNTSTTTSINSHLQFNVDVVLILGYTLSDERKYYLQFLLRPYNAGLQIWNDATPFNYEYITKTQRQVYIQPMPRALARQHRYVIKDKLPYYDFFLAFEDDMFITKHHIQYHLSFLRYIEALKKQQKQKQNINNNNQATTTTTTNNQQWWGPLTMDQLDRIKPGLLRVEVLTDPNRTIQSESSDPMRQHYITNDSNNNNNNNPQKQSQLQQQLQYEPFDPSICCHANHVGLQGKLAPQYPTSDQLILWETAIPAIFLRKFPKLDKNNYNDIQGDNDMNLNIDSHDPFFFNSNNDEYENNNDNGDNDNDNNDNIWMALLPIKGMPNSIPGYWSGTNGRLAPDYVKKPKSALNHFIGQSAGWMASQKEILHYDQYLCKGQFLPPFSEPFLQEDGMGFRTDSVEYWSGGLQLWGQQCEIQRVVAITKQKTSTTQLQQQLQPSSSSIYLDELFSRHLIYHTANNKQKEIVDKNRLVKVTTFWKQLQTVQQAAELDMNRETLRLQTNNVWGNFLHFLYSTFGWE